MSAAQKNYETAIEAAKKWLKDKAKDYTEGLRLLMVLSKGTPLPRNITRNFDSAKNLDKINYLLSKKVGAEYEPLPGQLLAVPTEEAKAKKKQRYAEVERNEALRKKGLEPLTDEAQASINAALESEGKKDLPEAIAEAQKELEGLKAQRNELSDKLFDADEKTAPDLVAQITEIDESMQAKVSFLSAYHKTGKVPAIHKPDETSTVQKDLKNLRSQKSRLESKLSKNPDNVEDQTKLAKINQEIEVLQDQRKLLDN
jgi:predicted nuclease with TOPRIM domain